MSYTTSERADVYTRVTNQIIKAIEQGVGAYQMPWHGTGLAFHRPVNAVTGRPYRGVNVLTLWTESQDMEYPDPVWATFKQWTGMGYRIFKGECATTAVFWKQLDAPTSDDIKDADKEIVELSSMRYVARAYPLFNAAQVDGYTAPKRPVLPEAHRLENVEAFCRKLGASIGHGGNEAYYQISVDHIQMPPFQMFADPFSYYSTLLHEVIHWTRHPLRLNREQNGQFGSDTYAMEELIAELGSAFVAADLGLTIEPKSKNAAYIDSWLKVLRSDNRAIFAAASQAQRAADYLHGLQPSHIPVLDRSVSSLTP